MSRKKSGKRAAQTFRETTDRILKFLEEVAGAQLTDQAVTWAVEAAIIKTAVAFERLMLECLVAAVNKDTHSTIGQTTGIKFPKHLTDEVCEYLVTGGGYFDFRGRDGLIKQIRRFVPEDHYLVTAVKTDKYKDPLNLLIALRNFAAHESHASKKAALKATGQQGIGTAGSWAKVKGGTRLKTLIGDLQNLATEIGNASPF